MFNHGNIRMPTGVARLRRLFVVTPDMHRVHHSAVILETNSNFGFGLPWMNSTVLTHLRILMPAYGFSSFFLLYITKHICYIVLI